MFRFPPEKYGGIIVVKIYKRTVGKTLELFKKHYEFQRGANEMLRIL